MRNLHVGKLLLSALFCCLSLNIGAQTSKNDGKTILDTLSIVSFNDFHGAFVKDRGIPGAGELVHAVLAQEQKNKNTIVVSVGDNFSGSYFSRITRGNPLPEMFKKMNVVISAVGNHEFDWGLPYLTDTASVYMDLVAANIAGETGEPLKWAEPFKIVEHKMKNGGGTVKIAFVGLTTTDAAHKTNPENIKGLLFTDPVNAARLQIANELKKAGKTDMIVLLIHIGTNMRDEHIIEEENAEQLPYLEGVDAIISGHSHEVVLAEVNKIPIIQAGVNGTHIGKLDFKISSCGDKNAITYLKGDTIRTDGEGDPYISDLVDKITNAYGLKTLLTNAEDDLIHDRTKNKWDYTPVGAYVTAAYVDCFTRVRNHLPVSLKDLPVFGVNHYGGLRASILKGEVTKLRAGNVLPFGGDVVAYTFRGDSLRKLLNDGRENKNGFLQTSYLKFKMDATGKRIEQLWDARTNKPVADNDTCVVVLDGYITDGGDQYDAALFKGNGIEEFNSRKQETTTAFIDYLKRLGASLSTEKTPVPSIIK